MHWIKPGLQGAGDLLIFSNQSGLTGKPYSTVMEITPPLNPDGSYYMTGLAFGPDLPTWFYKGDPPEDFYGLNMSSAQRLPDGNTLICNGPTRKIFEVTPSGENVWEYVNPYPTPDTNMIFRATRYPWDYPGLAQLGAVIARIQRSVEVVVYVTVSVQVGLLTPTFLMRAGQVTTDQQG